MSDMDAERIAFSTNVSGYPDPESSPAEGAELAGGSPTPQAQAPQHEPAPGSDRWNQVYGKMKDYERQNEDLKTRLAQYESLDATLAEAYQQSPQQPEPQQSQEYADGWEEMKQMFGQVVQESISPLQEQINEFRRMQTAMTMAEQFKARHPDYDPHRDDSALRPYLQRRIPLEEAWKLVQFDRGTVTPPAPNPPPAPAPMGDVQGSGPGAPTTSLEALVQEFQNTPEHDIEKRRFLASRISDFGYGSGEAEKALGL